MVQRSMCSACDDGSDGPEEQAQPSARQLTRRGLILGCLAVALAACVRGGGGERAGSGVGLWYSSVPGDTLASLSRRTGVSVERLAEINELDPAVLRPGTRLWLPGLRSLPPDPSAYTPSGASAKTPAKPLAPAGDDHYELVPRSAWTDEPVGPNHVLMGKVVKITIHHTDEHGGMEGKSDVDIVRMIENFHRNQKRWAAIGYHYLVGKDGRIYEGRPVRFQGAHCGKNENNLGISVIGDCHHNLPNAKQLKALKAFVDDQCERFNVPRSQVFGHRDIKPTICPGDQLYAWVQQYSGKR
jgi:N-acetylmuramoyl-L-alanine amidase